MVIITPMVKNSNKKTVFVGMSGGVDSSVSGAILKKQGYNVVGVFIKTWHPEFIVCNEEEERRDAMRAAAHLDIPFLTFDFEDVYKKEVADYMIREYKAGRTPNPDVMCNRHVKFGAFFKKALSMGADYVATGHYSISAPAKDTFAQVLGSPREYARPDHSQKHILLSLLKGKDPLKDQSYFLWTLRQEQLSKILFPVGQLNKIEVRKLAKKFKLPAAEKKDSQGICFLGAVDLKDFLKHYIEEKRGKVLNEKGEEIGYHDGVVFLTLGERHGFTITQKSPTDGAYYVVAKDIKKNVLTVSQKKPRKLFFERSGRAPRAWGEENRGPEKKDFLGLCLNIKNTNWISEIPKVNKNYTAQIRYHGEFLSCKVKILNKNSAKVFFNEPVLVDNGQSCVLYDKDIVLGGGVIS